MEKQNNKKTRCMTQNSKQQLKMEHEKVRTSSYDVDISHQGLRQNVTPRYSKRNLIKLAWCCCMAVEDDHIVVDWVEAVVRMVGVVRTLVVEQGDKPDQGTWKLENHSCLTFLRPVACRIDIRGLTRTRHENRLERRT